MARAAEGQPGPAPARAEVYETIALALAEVGQPQEGVLESFDLALALDPKNDRIRENRDIAAAPPPQSVGGRAARRRLLPAATVQPEQLRRARSDQINNRAELLNEQRRSLVSSGFVEV